MARSKIRKVDLDGTGVIVERPPIYTNHARRRMAEGRCGSYIVAKVQWYQEYNSPAVAWKGTFEVAYVGHAS